MHLIEIRHFHPEFQFVWSVAFAKRIMAGAGHWGERTGFGTQRKPKSLQVPSMRKPHPQIVSTDFPVASQTAHIK
jgi:hypothetical protein